LTGSVIFSIRNGSCMKFYFFQFLQAKRQTQIIILLLLLSVLPGESSATVYQCLTRDGILFLTNIPNNFPPGCQEVGDPIGEESAASSPGSISSAPPGSVRERNDRRAPALPVRPQPPQGPTAEAGSEGSNQTSNSQANLPGVLTHKKELEVWRGLAERMAARYQAIQNSSGSPSEKAEKLDKLENNLRMLRDNLAASPISPEEQAEIEVVLPPM
jgi:hypothetical protein